MCNYMRGWVFIKLTVVIILQYIQISYHYAVHLKLIQCSLSIISQQIIFSCKLPRAGECIAYGVFREDRAHI